MQYKSHSSYLKAVASGGSLGSEEPPPDKKGPPKGPLECMKRSTRMYKEVHYYNLLGQHRS